MSGQLLGSLRVVQVSFRSPGRMPDKIFDRLPDPYKIDNNSKERARLELNEDPSTVRDNVQRFREMVQAEPNLNSRTDDSFLLAFLRGRKHNLDKALLMLKNYYNSRKTFGNYMEPFLPSENREIYQFDWMRILERRDQEGRGLAVIRFGPDVSSLSAENLAQMMCYTMELAIIDPNIQVNGLVALVDLSTVNLRHLKFLTPTFVRLIARLFQDSFPLRVKKVCAVGHSKIYQFFFSLITPLLKKKMKERFLLLGNDYETLHSIVDPNALPKFMKGTVKVPSSEWYIKETSQYDEIFREGQKYGYLET